MGQVSVLVSVFGGETAKPEHGLWLVICDDYDYYYYGPTLYIIWIIEYPWDGSTSWIFMVVTFFISPLCGVAQTPDCGMLVICLLYKPFMWCRSDARLRHAFCCRPFEASLQTPDRCIFYFYSRIAYSCFIWTTCWRATWIFISWLTLWS